MLVRLVNLVTRFSDYIARVRMTTVKVHCHTVSSLVNVGSSMYPSQWHHKDRKETNGILRAHQSSAVIMSA
jgi:hypothetical protein